MDLNTSGRARRSSMHLRGPLMLRFSFSWADKKISWDLASGCKDNGAPVRCWLLVPMDWS